MVLYIKRVVGSTEFGRHWCHNLTIWSTYMDDSSGNSDLKDSAVQAVGTEKHVVEDLILQQ